MIRLHELRTLKGLTQKQLAEKIGVMNYTIGNWEQGRVEPDIANLISLADAFECSVDYLIGRENEFGNIIINGDLSESEKECVGLFAALTDEKKRILLSVMRDMVSAEKTR
ncbi:MAG: helix-turn-helix transcriptional regulator [Clostridia bacterium]|nr:helix-turn-helix transcriptional regulator [Clostridia bacterium]